jgi:hypothetical protein
MGASRRTQTIAVTASSGSGSGGGNLGPPRQRNLGKGELGAVIFGCTNATMSECLNQNLFGKVFCMPFCVAGFSIVSQNFFFWGQKCCRGSRISCMSTEYPSFSIQLKEEEHLCWVLL